MNSCEGGNCPPVLWKMYKNLSLHLQHLDLLADNGKLTLAIIILTIQTLKCNFI